MCNIYIENCSCTKCGRKFSRQIRQSTPPTPGYVQYVPWCSECSPPQVRRVRIVEVLDDRSERCVGEGRTLDEALLDSQNRRSGLPPTMVRYPSPSAR